MPRQRPSQHTYWVNDQLLAGHYPGDTDEETAAKKIRAYLDAGVDFFVDLTRVGEMSPYEHLLRAEAEALGKPAEYRRFTIRDMGVPPADEMAHLLNLLDQAVETGRTVYVHCWGGVGRTGTVVGCYLVRHGMTGDEALSWLRGVWPSVAQSAWHRSTPETREQQRYIKNWREN